MTTHTTPRQTTTAGIVRAIVEARKRQDLSAPALAERTNGAMSHATLANLESGRKRVISVDELLALARALDVPPLSLIYPDLIDTPTGDGRTQGEAALDFCGYRDDDSPMQWLFRIHNARKDFEAWGMSDNEMLRDNARQTLRMAEHGARAAGWKVNNA